MRFRIVLLTLSIVLLLVQIITAIPADEERIRVEPIEKVIICRQNSTEKETIPPEIQKREIIPLKNETHLIIISKEEEIDTVEPSHPLETDNRSPSSEPETGDKVIIDTNSSSDGKEGENHSTTSKSMDDEGLEDTVTNTIEVIEESGRADGGESEKENHQKEEKASSTTIDHRGTNRASTDSMDTKISTPSDVDTKEDETAQDLFPDEIQILPFEEDDSPPANNLPVDGMDQPRYRSSVRENDCSGIYYFLMTLFFTAGSVLFYLSTERGRDIRMKLGRLRR